jgi:hypothetical protein
VARDAELERIPPVAPTQPFADTELALEPIATPAAGDYVPPTCG